MSTFLDHVSQENIFRITIEHSCVIAKPQEFTYRSHTLLPQIAGIIIYIEGDVAGNHPSIQLLSMGLNIGLA